MINNVGGANENELTKTKSSSSLKFDFENPFCDKLCQSDFSNSRFASISPEIPALITCLSRTFNELAGPKSKLNL